MDLLVVVFADFADGLFLCLDFELDDGICIVQFPSWNLWDVL